MRIPFLKTSLILSTALLTAPLVTAQTTAEDEEARQDTIVVTGTPIRDSQIAALAAKRNADNILDVVAADTIGRFPDATLAASLTRIPGLAVESDQGEARFLNFRGGRFRYTTISFDDILVPGADDGRIPRFDSIPSIITSRIEASKAITPATPGGALLGHINIETYSPFDKEGFGFAGTYARGERTLRDADLERYGLRASYSTDQFGVLAFASSDERGRIVDNREYGIDPEAGTLDNLDFRQYGGERETYSYGGKVEFRPESDAVDRVFASTLYYEFGDNELRNQFDFDFGDLPGSTPNVPLGTSGIVTGVEARALSQSGRYETATFTNTIGADLNIGEWIMEPRLTYSESTNYGWLPLGFWTATTGFDAFYDITDINDPALIPYAPGTTTPINLFDDLSYDNPSNFLFNLLIDDTTIEQVLLQNDVTREMTLFGRDTEIKFGAAYDRREVSGTGDAREIIAGDALTVNISDFVTTELWEQDFDNTIPAYYFRNEALVAASGVTPPTVPTPDEIIELEEDLISVYAQAKTDFDWGNVVYGVRVESTDFSTEGTTLDMAGTDSIQTLSNDYLNVLPSVHVNIDLTDDVKLRFSGTTGISRPNYAELRASQDIDPIERELSGGNPFLDPEESIGFDASLEWYFDEASILSVGAFYRSIDNVIYEGATLVDGSQYSNFFDSGEQVLASTFLNGEDGELSGLEINFLGQATFLPEPFDGFGVSGNATFLDSEFFAPTANGGQGETLAIPGTSELIYNASIFYEKFGLSARLAYQYRDEWLTTTEAGPGEPLFWGETERVDAKIQYELPFEFGGGTTVVFAEANNLSDFKDERYVGEPQFADQIEGYGRFFMFGISYDY
ncbi:MAG: TonB-dependent receptor [Pseudomonadota bacterium]